MAEFCLECWNRINNTKHKKRQYIMSDYLDLCEGCGQMKQVILVHRASYWRRKFIHIFFPVLVVLLPVLILLRLCIDAVTLCYNKVRRKNKDV